LKNKTCYVGAPESFRDYMFIDDHINAYLLSMKSEKAIGETFNVSPGNPISNRKLAHIIAEITDFKGKILYGSYPPGYPQRSASLDPTHLVLDATKINKFLCWKPTVTLKEGLKKAVDYWRTKNK